MSLKFPALSVPFRRGATKGAAVNIKMPTGNRDTLLLMAAKRGELAIVQSLLDKGEYVDRMDNAGRTALHHAVQTASVKLVKLLSDRGADVNRKTGDGYTTPLHCALCAPFLQCIVEPPNSTTLTTQLGRGAAIVRILIDRGANVRATTKLGKTPEDLAVGGGDMAVLALVRAAVKRRVEGDCEVFFSSFTLVTGARRSLSSKLSDARVYEPQIRAHSTGVCHGAARAAGRGVRCQRA